MKVLIACEFSGIVRDAFAARGHDATSCDLLPSETPGKHIEGDVLSLLVENWDLIIAHPPCTFLCNSGVRWLSPGGVLNSDRYEEMRLACDFFAALYWSKSKRVCIENPVMHGHARRRLEFLGVPTFTQSIQPWQHGHGETKRTCLWLRGLPPLVPSAIVSGRNPVVHHEPPSTNRWRNRSRTKPGIAAAMAEQWNVNPH